MLPQNWEAIAQERSRAWEAAVRQRQLQALLPRPHATWRRRTGVWLVRVGSWITQWGKALAEAEGTASVSVVG